MGKKMTFALAFCNRGFMPGELIYGAREDMIKAVTNAGYDYIAMDAELTRYGGVETRDEGILYAKWLKEHDGEYDGVIFSMPIFADENGAITALQDAGVPILMQAYPDEIGKMDFAHRRDAYCGKFSVTDVFTQYQVPFTVMKPHVVHPLSEAFAQNLKDFAAICRVVNGMKRFNVGCIGARTTAFKTVRFDEITLQKYGINVESFDLSELMFKVSKKADDDAVVLEKVGESLTEACSEIGEKNATNDHSPRDLTVAISSMSDLTFGLSGFRFARVELLTEESVAIRNIFAVNMLPKFEKEGYITTSDAQLNQIIETAIYTLKLNFQNGYIWDGIKRDRLVWSGDLNQEIISSIYLFGDNKNITNSLSFLRSETPPGEWINTFPTYSAWWVINLCDYCKLTGNREYFEANQDYAKAILTRINGCITEDGKMDFQPNVGIEFFLDWPTCGKPDAVTGTAALLIYAAKKYLDMEENEDCRTIICKLESYLGENCEFKQTRAFQILAGRIEDTDKDFLEQGGAKGFSTFMSYYILKADTMANGQEMLSLMKEYFGAMLSRGATTFWEDFHMEWLDGSGRIDEFPKDGEKDIHGDYGAFCYEGFRHSLCHGWASGVLAFFIEHILGLELCNSGESYNVRPNTMGLEEIYAKIPIAKGWLEIHICDNHIYKRIITL